MVVPEVLSSDVSSSLLENSLNWEIPSPAMIGNWSDCFTDLEIL